MSSPRILLVEDNEANVYLVRFLLERAGAVVRVVHNGLDCLAAVQTEPPDLIVMDLQMPIMDGYEAARRLRAEPATAAIPLVASSAFAQSDDEQKALAAGFDGYIAKPFEPDTFATLVLAHLTR